MYHIPNLDGVKVYRALLTQAGTDDPVATVFENSLGGEVVWSRVLAGLYAGASIGAFPANKTWVSPRSFSDSQDTASGAWLKRIDNDFLQLVTFLLPSTLQDGLLADFPIQILVYP